MNVLHVLTAAVVALVSFAVPLSAHHAWPVSRDKLVTVKGTVNEFTWANPHPMITLDVRTDDGQKIIRLERVTLADGKEMRLYGR